MRRVKDKIDEVLVYAELKIKACLKEAQKANDREEALGYKTSLECIKRSREHFDIYPYGKEKQ